MGPALPAKWSGRALTFALCIVVSLLSSADPVACHGQRAVLQDDGGQLSVAIPAGGDVLPVVLWHGMGDSCCASYSIGAVASFISDQLGVFVHSISTGETTASDVASTYWGRVNDQVAAVCEQLRQLPELQNGYNAIGFSQGVDLQPARMQICGPRQSTSQTGGQFLRAVAQRCRHAGPPMRTLITMGSQHQGVYNLPNCGTDESDPAGKPSSACLAIQYLLGASAYAPFVRDNVVQAQYFKDPYNLEGYLRHNPFLPDINNELAVKNETYRANLVALDRLVLLRFEDDGTVVPRASEWFGFFDGNQLVEMRDSDLYKEDWIGLRELDESGRLVLGHVPGAHMHFSLEWLLKNVVNTYLRGAYAPNDPPGASAQQ